ncbi:hypothetical protein MNEG_11392 [Monoraphidium neglectum]|uniref:Uncharacterized protein n=1 Tax=Monoraphidium neglectum TaxID=145388 RepID=A0A0D2KLD7_9CHLO|nr:hypothetical protein MNEG_11392 [Monoraphidium neglectum]KIY96568.1 hypothetical protein MNEG_11392 [Monoraphidium neglectum]|eukprot:XP_013895588.1 hypothetical protein MNEG_11392 [Monoraphidium neglectum]
MDLNDLAWVLHSMAVLNHYPFLLVSTLLQRAGRQLPRLARPRPSAASGAEGERECEPQERALPRGLVRLLCAAAALRHYDPGLLDAAAELALRSAAGATDIGALSTLLTAYAHVGHPHERLACAAARALAAPGAARRASSATLVAAARAFAYLGFHDEGAFAAIASECDARTAAAPVGAGDGSECVPAGSQWLGEFGGQKDLSSLLLVGGA